jgi:hypothetical protein
MGRMKDLAIAIDETTERLFDEAIKLGPVVSVESFTRALAAAAVAAGISEDQLSDGIRAAYRYMTSKLEETRAAIPSPTCGDRGSA